MYSWSLQIEDILGQGILFFIERWPAFGGTGIIENAMSSFERCQSVLYQRFHCIL